MVEKDTGLENSLVMDVRNNHNTTALTGGGKPIPHRTVFAHGQPSPAPSPDGRIYPRMGELVKDYVEVWDYVAGARFRGFVAEKGNMRTMFIFFDKEVIGMDLKPG